MISKNRIKQIHALARKKGRQAEGLFVAEGPKLVTELQGSFELEALFDDLTEDELNKASLLQSPQGPIALFKIPAWELPQPAAGTLYLALDTVQDPGNLGTIVRVADWHRGYRMLVGLRRHLRSESRASHHGRSGKSPRALHRPDAVARSGGQ